LSSDREDPIMLLIGIMEAGLDECGIAVDGEI
jgi:hypothetical protein